MSNLELLCAEIEADQVETAVPSNSNPAAKKNKKKSNKSAKKQQQSKKSSKTEEEIATEKQASKFEVFSKSDSIENSNEDEEEEDPIEEILPCDCESLEKCPVNRMVRNLPDESLLLNLISSSSSSACSDRSKSALLTSGASSSFDHPLVPNRSSSTRFNAAGSIGSSNYSSFCCLSYDCDCNENDHVCSDDEDLITEEEKNEYYANKDSLLHERMNRRELLRQQFQNLKLNSNFKIRPRNVS